MPHEASGDRYVNRFVCHILTEERLLPLLASCPFDVLVVAVKGGRHVKGGIKKAGMGLQCFSKHHTLS